MHFEPTLNPGYSHLEILYCVCRETLFQLLSHSQVRGLGLWHVFWGSLFSPLQQLILGEAECSRLGVSGGSAEWGAGDQVRRDRGSLLSDEGMIRFLSRVL